MCCTQIPNLQSVCAAQAFPRDDARKNSAETHESDNTLRSGPEVKDREERAKKYFTVEVKKQNTLGRNEYKIRCCKERGVHMRC